MQYAQYKPNCCQNTDVLFISTKALNQMNCVGLIRQTKLSEPGLTYKKTVVIKLYQHTRKLFIQTTRVLRFIQTIPNFSSGTCIEN